MTSKELVRLRLVSQQLAVQTAHTAAEVVASFGAMQAQDYTSALWAIGLRLPEGTEVSVERAVAERQIVRTWPMRGSQASFLPAAKRYGAFLGTKMTFE